MQSDRPYRPAAELQRVLDDVQRMGNPLDLMTRANVGALWLLREAAAGRVIERIPLSGVCDLCVPARNRQIPVRVYTPAGGGRLPMLIYYHGGGWSLGSLATHDSLCRALARGSGAVVVSVDYRLAPEHPFPAAVEDAYLALEWAARNADLLGGDIRRLAVGGDSAGGTLATVAAVRAHKAGLPVAFQALFYPSADISHTDYPSYLQYGEDHWLTTRACETFRDFYLPNRADWMHPEASPLLASDDDLRRLPPALILTPGCDPLRDEGRAYAERLRALGVRVEYRLESEVIHGCLTLFNNPLYPDASRRVAPLLDSLAAALREALTAQ